MDTKRKSIKNKICCPNTLWCDVLCTYSVILLLISNTKRSYTSFEHILLIQYIVPIQKRRRNSIHQREHFMYHIAINKFEMIEEAEWVERKRGQEREKDWKTNSANCDSDRKEAPEVIFHLISFQERKKHKRTKPTCMCMFVKAKCNCVRACNVLRAFST